MATNAQVQRSSASVALGTVLSGGAGTDVTFASSNAKYSSNPLLTDRVVVNPQALLPGGLQLGAAFVSAAGVITARFTSMSTANVVGGTVGLNVDLIKATGSI